MCLSIKKQLKRCGVNASCVCQQGSSSKSCGFYASCVCQQGSRLKVAVSVHHMVVNKGADFKLQCLCIMWLSTGKQIKSCGV